MRLARSTAAWTSLEPRGGRDVQAAGAHGHQQILDGVGDRTHGRAPHDVGGSLERVDRAEERGHAGILPTRIGERQQRRGHRLQVLGGFRHEVADDLVAAGEEAHELVPQRVLREARRRIGLDDGGRRDDLRRHRPSDQCRGLGFGCARSIRARTSGAFIGIEIGGRRRRADRSGWPRACCAPTAPWCRPARPPAGIRGATLPP